MTREPTPYFLEVACTANHGRSRPAEADLRRLIELNHLEDIVHVSSSGTQAASIAKGEYDFNGILYVLKKGHFFDQEAKDNTGKKGIAPTLFTDKEAQFIGDLLRHEGIAKMRYEQEPETKKAINRHLITATKGLSAYEHQQREEYLAQAGLVLDGVDHRQTQANGNLDLFVGMTRTNADQARIIWEEADTPYRWLDEEKRAQQRTLITNYEAFTGKAISDGWGRATPEAFERMYKTLEEQNSILLRKVRDELSL